MLQVLFCAMYFLLGLGSYLMLDGGTGEMAQGNILSTAFTVAAIWLGMIGLSIVALFVLWKRKTDWYVVVAVAFLVLIIGAAIGILQDLIFINPAEYGERGWAWAAGKYGAWRVLK